MCEKKIYFFFFATFFVAFFATFFTAFFAAGFLVAFLTTFFFVAIVDTPFLFIDVYSIRAYEKYVNSFFIFFQKNFLFFNYSEIHRFFFFLVFIFFLFVRVIDRKNIFTYASVTIQSVNFGVIPKLCRNCNASAFVRRQVRS